MRHVRVALFVSLAAALVSSGPLLATQPETGHVAIAGAGGLVVPFEGDYKLGFHLDGSMDYYVSPTIGVRATAGYMREGTDVGGANVSAGYLLGSGVYFWDRGKLRPFAQAGLGFYSIEPVDGGHSGRLGLHAGGGVEYFLDRRTAVTGAALLHFVGSVGGRSSSFLALTGGIRYHF